MPLLVPLSLDTRYEFAFIVEIRCTCCYMQPDVVELRQQMTPNMTAIQIAVLDIMKACVTELKRCNSSVSFHSDIVIVSVCMHVVNKINMRCHVVIPFCQS